MSEILMDRLFLGAGAMKAGTTWLFSLLARHPDITFTPEKEIHYLYARYVRPDVLSEARRIENARTKYLTIEPQRAAVLKERLRWTANYLDGPVDDHWYRMLFAHRPDGSWAADFSNMYALLPEHAWAQTAARVPRLRVLYTMRDPIERLWSHAKFHLRIIGKPAAAMEWPSEDLVAFVRQPFIWENAEYGAALRRMRAALPPSSLKVMFHEEVHADEAASLSDIERFLGIGHIPYPRADLEKRLNSTSADPVPDGFRNRLQADAARIISEVRDLGYEPPVAWEMTPTVDEVGAVVEGGA